MENPHMNYRATQLLIVIAHFLVAILATSIQPLLPYFQERFSLGILESSLLPLSVTFAVMAANLFVGFLIARLGQKTVLLGAVVIEIAGIVTIALSNSFVAVLSGFAILGFAAGAAFTALVTVYSGLPEKYRNFGVFHGFFGAGGIVSPILASVWLSAGLGIGGLFALYGVLFLVLLLCLLSPERIPNLRFGEFSPGAMLRTLSSPVVLAGVGALSLYAAAEVGGATWGANTAMMSYGFGKNGASYLLSGFWLAFTFSRFITDPLARRTGELKLVSGSIILAVLALAVWIGGVSPYAFPVFGLALGPVFPVIQKYVNGRLPEQERGLFNGVTYLGTGIATTLFIPLMGAIGENSLALAYIPLVVSLVSMTFLLRYLYKK